MTNKNFNFNYFSKNISIVFAIVLIWRGIWYILDKVDLLLFGGGHMLTAVGGVVLGIIILYLPDKDLKEISKL
jgi:presenilin-like A22 family membrane protease